MKNKNLIYSFIVLVIFCIFTFVLVKHVEDGKGVKYIRIGGTDIKVELAVTKDEQVRGLSGRESLAEDTGMLFVFNQPGKYYFWMKNMNFPIDMIWLDHTGKILYIKNNADPESYLETYGPEENSSYVLEVVAGFAEKHNVKVGDKVEFPK